MQYRNTATAFILTLLIFLFSFRGQVAHANEGRGILGYWKIKSYAGARYVQKVYEEKIGVGKVLLRYQLWGENGGLLENGTFLKQPAQGVWRYVSEALESRKIRTGVWVITAPAEANWADDGHALPFRGNGIAETTN